MKIYYYHQVCCSREKSPNDGERLEEGMEVISKSFFRINLFLIKAGLHPSSVDLGPDSINSILVPSPNKGVKGHW